MDTAYRCVFAPPAIVVVDEIEDEDPFWLWTPERLDAME